MYQLSLFSDSKKRVVPQKQRRVDPEFSAKARYFTQRALLLDLSLKGNREYVVFAKKMLKVALELDDYLNSIATEVGRRVFRAKVHAAKRELTEIKTWLELLDKGKLLKGDYKQYLDEVNELLIDVQMLKMV